MDWLNQVNVRAFLQPLNPVRIADGRVGDLQHEHGLRTGALPLLQPATDLETVNVWQVDVEYRHVHGLRFGNVEGLTTRRRLAHPKSCSAKDVGLDEPSRLMIIDDEYQWSVRCHGATR